MPKAFALTVFHRRRLNSDSQQLGLHVTSKQQATFLERSNTLRRKIKAWCDVQTLYIPGASVLRDNTKRELPIGAPEERVQDMELWLPSAINRQVPFERELEEIEYQLRFT